MTRSARTGSVYPLFVCIGIGNFQNSILFECLNAKEAGISGHDLLDFRVDRIDPSILGTLIPSFLQGGVR